MSAWVSLTEVDSSFDAAAAGLSPGRYATVLVTGAGPHHLQGELLSSEAAASRRPIAIPLLAATS